MKSTFNHMSDVIKRAAETRAAMIKLRAAQKIGFISRNLSILTIAGITLVLLVIINIGNH
jgi:hypothetical protein